MTTNDRGNLKFLEELHRQSRAEIGFSVSELCRIEEAERWVMKKSEHVGGEGYWIAAIAHRLIDSLDSSVLANRLLDLSQASTANRLKLSALAGGLQAARKIVEGFAPGNRITQGTQLPGAITHVFFPEGVPATADEQQSQNLKRCTVERRLSAGMPVAELSRCLARVRQDMLREGLDGIFGDPAAASIIVDFDFRFQGIQRSQYGFEDRRTKFKSGFPDTDDWKSLDLNWGYWDLLIQLRANGLN